MTYQSSSSKRWRWRRRRHARSPPPPAAIHNFRRNPSPLARSLASVDPQDKICSDPLSLYPSDDLLPPSASSIPSPQPQSSAAASEWARSPVHCKVGIVLALAVGRKGWSRQRGLRPRGGRSSSCCSSWEGGEQGEEEARPGGAAADRGPDQPAGALLQAAERAVQQGLRALRALRRPGRAHRLLPRRPPLPVRLLWLQHWRNFWSILGPRQHNKWSQYWSTRFNGWLQHTGQAYINSWQHLLSIKK